MTAWAERSGTGNSGGARQAALSASLVCLVLASGLTTNAMGVHSILGAFLADVVMPRDNKLIKELTGRVEGVVLWMMLPLFFMTVGLQRVVMTFGESLLNELESALRPPTPSGSPAAMR